MATTQNWYLLLLR